MSYDVYDRLFVEIFNDILKLEQNTIKKSLYSDLSLNELHTLDAIDHLGDTKMRNIAQRLKITLSTLTTAVNNLIKKGYAITKRDELDKRVVKVMLTQKAKDALSHHAQFHKNMVNSMLSTLNKNEKQTLESCLHKLCDYFIDLQDV